MTEHMTGPGVGEQTEPDWFTVAKCRGKTDLMFAYGAVCESWALQLCAMGVVKPECIVWRRPPVLT